MFWILTQTKDTLVPVSDTSWFTIVKGTNPNVSEIRMYDSFGSDDKTITTLGFWNSVNDAQLVFDRISTLLKNRYNGPQNFVYEVPNDVKEDKNER